MYGTGESLIGLLNLHPGWPHVRSGPVNLEEVERGDRGVQNDKPGQTAPSMDPGQAGMLPLSRGAGSEVQIPTPALECSKNKKKTASSNTQSTVDWKTQYFHWLFDEKPLKHSVFQYFYQKHMQNPYGF